MTAEELIRWYYEEVAKLGLRRSDAEGIWWHDKPTVSCFFVPFPDGRTEPQLREILKELAERVRVATGG